MLIAHGAPVRRNDAGRIVFLKHKRPASRLVAEIGPTDDRRILSPEPRAEID
jgi:hypothetical protein